MKIQVSNNRILIPFESGLANGWIEGEPVLQRSPIARPKFLMPYQLWRQAVSFMVDAFDELKVETQVLFFKSETEWKLFCPLQEATASTTELYDCKENTMAFDLLASQGFEKVGSVHSHCNMSAFASGTDNADEKSSCDGFHITVGKMNETILDHHCRAYVTILGDPATKTPASRHKLNFYIEDFIEGVPNFDNVPFYVPHEARDKIIKYHFLNRDDLVEFPENWLERVIKPQPKYYPPARTTDGNGVWISGVEHRIANGKMEPVDPKVRTDYEKFWERQARLEEQWKEEDEEARLQAQVDEQEEKEELETLGFNPTVF